MKRQRSHCPIAHTLDVVGDPWSLLIVRDLALKGLSTYTQFLKGGEAISTNILADRLDRLLSSGVIERSESGGRYTLTDKGLDLIPLLLELIAWGAAYDPETAASPAFVHRILHDREALIEELLSFHLNTSPTDSAP